MNKILKLSIDASLFVQVITLLLNFFAFFVPIERWDFALKEILGLETLVQIIELIFYGWYRNQILEKLTDVARFRYYDWVITTPVMLFSTASYYGYLEQRESEEKKEPFSVLTFFQENLNWILLMLVFNGLMLYFGYLQEVGRLSIVWSSLLGYFALLGSFGILYRFVSKVSQQHILFWLMFSVWSLYGVAAMLPSIPKNISYNILDIFAKNFYGLFLGYLIFQRRQN